MFKRTRKLTPISKGMIRELQVQRVDGVGAPATGRQWVLVKSDDTPDAALIAKTAIEALLKEQNLVLSKETVDALHALAALLEVEATFKSVEQADAPDESAADAADEPDADAIDKDDDEDDDDLPAEDADDEDEADAPEGDDADDADDVEKDADEDDALPSTRDGMLDLIREAIEGMVADAPDGPKSTRKSRQARVQDTDSKKPVEKGNGIFTSIIFGQK